MQVLQAVEHCTQLIAQQRAPWAAVLVAGHAAAPTAWHHAPRTCRIGSASEHDTLLVFLGDRKYLAFALLGSDCQFAGF